MNRDKILRQDQFYRDPMIIVHEAEMESDDPEAALFMSYLALQRLRAIWMNVNRPGVRKTRAAIMQCGF